MALLYATGFDLHGNAADLTMDQWTLSATGNQSGISSGINTTNGRQGGQALFLNNGASNGAIGYFRQMGTQGAGAVHMFVGAASNCPGAFAPLGVWDAGTVQVSLQRNADGSVTALRGATSLGATSAGVASAGVYHYWEIDVVIGSGTSGSIAAYLDGIQILNLTGQNTQNTANSTWSQVMLGFTVPNSANTFFDDVYVCDTTTASLNSNLGDVRIVGRLPTGAGTYTNLTKVGAAATNWQSVNQNPTDGDTTYVTSPTISTQDTYTYPLLPADTATVLAVVPHPNARKDDAGFRTLSTHFRQTVTPFSEADSPTSTAMTLGYAFYEHVCPINPVTSAAWTVTDVNQMEIGPKVAA